MGEKHTLGIIVNSNRYFNFVTSLADAALDKGIHVRIHLLGSGCEYINTRACIRLGHLIRITLCSASAHGNTLQQIESIKGWISLVPPQVLSMVMQACNRSVIF